jgi:hypothetical protein
LATVREIARLDPEPTAWDDERRSYERAWYGQCLQRSRGHAAEKKTRQVLATLMELQTAPAIEKPPPKLIQDLQKVVRQAAMAESGDVVEELERLQTAGDFEGLRKALLRWKEILELSSGELDAEITQRASAVITSLDAHDRFVAKEREFESALAELKSRLVNPSASVEEIEAAHHRTFGSHRVLPMEVAQAVQTRVGALRRRQQHKRIAIGTASAVAVGLIASVVYYFHLQSVTNWNAAALAEEVQSLVKEGKLEAAREKINAAERSIVAHAAVVPVQHSLAPTRRVRRRPQGIDRLRPCGSTSREARAGRQVDGVRSERTVGVR